MLDEDGEILRQFLWLGWRPAAILTEDGTFHVHTDLRGAPLAVTDASGRIVWRAVYEPFGRASVDDDPDGDGERFVLHLSLPGQWEGPATGLHYKSVALASGSTKCRNCTTRFGEARCGAFSTAIPEPTFGCLVLPRLQ